MLNKMIIMGRLTREPELRHTADGAAVANFAIAHERDWRGAAGEKITDFYDVVAWRSTAEFAAKWLGKGRLVVVSGKTQIRTYTDRDGSKRTKLELVADEIFFADSKPAAQPPVQSDEELPAASSQDWEELVGEDKDLPF